MSTVSSVMDWSSCEDIQIGGVARDLVHRGARLRVRKGSLGSVSTCSTDDQTTLAEETLRRLTDDLLSESDEEQGVGVDAVGVEAIVQDVLHLRRQPRKHCRRRSSG
mmetsp:Transcript_126937/g.290444  ORF Transcript_126937/g.290444 Transcript_126937/m.290444 type:complete len:107 (+) Transcript_126937:74-394(+)